jgi:hypothetical protein
MLIVLKIASVFATEFPKAASAGSHGKEFPKHTGVKIFLSFHQKVFQRLLETFSYGY